MDASDPEVIEYRAQLARLLSWPASAANQPQIKVQDADQRVSVVLTDRSSVTSIALPGYRPLAEAKAATSEASRDALLQCALVEYAALSAGSTQASSVLEKELRSGLVPTAAERLREHARVLLLERARNGAAADALADSLRSAAQHHATAHAEALRTRSETDIKQALEAGARYATTVAALRSHAPYALFTDSVMLQGAAPKVVTESAKRHAQRTRVMRRNAIVSTAQEAVKKEAVKKEAVKKEAVKKEAVKKARI